MTKEDLSDYGERLLSLQRWDPARKAQHEQEMRNLVEQRLTTARKLRVCVSVLVSIGLTIWLGTGAFVSSGRPPISRFIHLAGFLYSLAFVIRGIAILRKGKINRRRDTVFTAALAWFFVLTMVVLFAIKAETTPNLTDRLQLIGFSLMFLIATSAAWIRARIAQSELKMQEHLLQVQYALAELLERAPAKPE